MSLIHKLKTYVSFVIRLQGYKVEKARKRNRYLNYRSLFAIMVIQSLVWPIVRVHEKVARMSNVPK